MLLACVTVLLFLVDFRYFIVFYLVCVVLFMNVLVSFLLNTYISQSALRSRGTEAGRHQTLQRLLAEASARKNNHSWTVTKELTATEVHTLNII